MAQLVAESKLPVPEARRLLSQATGLSRVALIAHPDTLIDEVAQKTFWVLVSRRQSGEPMAYVVGQREFFGRGFKVNAHVLIPRPDTELLVECALTCMDSQPFSVLDLGTGSGAVAVTLALERPGADITATDVSAAALNLAQENAEALGAANVAWQCANWYEGLGEQRYDLIVSNPPYISVDDIHLTQGDLRFEPRVALTDGNDGLSALATIIGGAPRHLRTNGWLLVEHGYDQAERVRRLFGQPHWNPPSSWRDLAGIERVTGASLALVD